MKNKTTLLTNAFLATVFAVNLSSGQWQSQTSPTTQKLEALYFTSPTTGFTSSSNTSQLYKTVDAGVTWATVGAFSSRDLWFIDSNIGFASSSIASASGTMKKTTNGGSAWTQITAPNSSSYLGVSATSATNAYFINTEGKVIKTTNGGTSVTSYTLPLTTPSSQSLMDIFFVNATTGFVCAQGGQIFRTTNSGTSWTALTPNVGTSALNSLYFTDALTGYATGSGGKVIKTTDGGTTWVDKSVPGNFAFNGVRFFDANVGLVVGLSGRIFRTMDGGDTWVQQASGTTEHLRSVFFLNATSAIIVGDAGTILKNNDVLSEKDFVLKPVFSLAPNPIDETSVLSVQNVEDFSALSIEIYDVTGKLVKKDAIKSQHYNLSRSEFTPGVYVIKIKDGSGVLETQKFIVK
ncbi:T9SS type A sorting domain-containing protein [Flavobacterium sp.]|uniref:YCF48-related protein n=1 Tax=Flavobacterium sp. TaxID=239 RepID=UPI00120FFBEE|nr:T9SS type A sorting domain-containing protein [Flavobacterium sp.]RZJ73994.1 MAG: T9SS type A sorting domain-containing protein [Flavobacterium sp.]